MTSLEAILQSYGVVAVFIGTFLEGETVLVLAGLAAHRGYLPLPAVIAVGFLGSLLGTQLFFHIGRMRGEATLARHPGWAARVERTRGFLDRHDTVFILGFRFLYGLRSVSPFVIGMSRVGTLRFLVLDVLGAAVWAVAISLLGYSVGHGAELLIERTEKYEGWLFGGVLLAGAIAWGVHFARQRRAST